MSYLIFDMDGTLIDSTAVVTQAMDTTLRECAGVTLSREKLLTFLGPPLAATIGKYAPAGMTPAQIIAAYRERYFSHETEIQLFPAARQFIEAASRQGHRLAVATAKRQDAAERILEQNGVAHYFELVSGAPDDHIPDKSEIIRLVLEHWDFPNPAEVLMIGDRIHDIEGADANGLRTVIVTWGETSIPAEIEKAWAAAGNFAELLDCVAAASGQKAKESGKE